MIAFDEHIPSIDKQAVIVYDLICRFLFSSILVDVCGKSRIFRLYSYLSL